MIRMLCLLALCVSGCSRIGAALDAKRTLGVGSRVVCNDAVVPAVVDTGMASIAATAVLAGLIVPAVAKNDPDSDVDLAGLASGFLITSGLAIGIPYASSASYGWARVRRCSDANRPAAITRRSQGLRAAVLTNQALDAAKVGDCPRVAKLGAVIWKLDEALHRKVFAKTPALHGCLTITSGAPATTATPSSPHCLSTDPAAPSVGICLQSLIDCERAIALLPTGSPPTTCIPAGERTAP